MHSRGRMGSPPLVQRRAVLQERERDLAEVPVDSEAGRAASEGVASAGAAALAAADSVADAEDRPEHSAPGTDPAAMALTWEIGPIEAAKASMGRLRSA